MNITAARLEGDRLTLDIGDSVSLQEARRWIFGFKPGRWQLKKEKQRRSLDANAYAWVLINKIAQAVGIPPVEVYRNAIRDIPGVARMGCFQVEDIPGIARAWTSKGLGWQVVTLDNNGTGWVYVMLYCGSSVYDRAQMSRLIDSLVQDCRALDIETRDPNDIASLLEAWE